MQEIGIENAPKRITWSSNDDNQVNVKKSKNKVKKSSNGKNDEIVQLETTNGITEKLQKQKRKAEEIKVESPYALGKIKKQKESKFNGEIKDNEQSLQEEKNGETEKSIKNIDTSIFQYFTDLTHQSEDERLKAATQLIQQLQRTKEPEKRQKELAYALKRLIRGCGAATNASRAGFFTGLVAFLKTFSNDEIEISQIFDTIQKELNVGTTIANKEDADAVVGKILVCGALLRSERMLHLNCEHLERVTNILLQATKHRTYHASLSYAFLIDILETALTQQQFEDAVWPLLQKELCKSWSKQTLQTVHCLIILQRKFPTVLNAKFMKAHFGGRELLNDESYVHLQRIFWMHSDTHIITHPAFEAFGAFLADCSNLVEFWTQTVDAGLQTPTKLLEFLTLKIATDLLQNLKQEKATLVIENLLSPNFMRMLINGLKQIKVKKDETLKAFYDEYMEALLACCTKLPTSADEQKVAIIRRLILYPGSFDIEKFTSTRIVHQLINTLGLEGVQEVFLLYKQIFCGMLLKEVEENKTEDWQHFERLNAGYMLQHLLAHKVVQHQANAYEWRSRQLHFLMVCGIFNVQPSTDDDDDIVFEPCKKEAAGCFSKDFGEQCKNMFYASLQSKLANLQQERSLLMDLAQFCDKRMQKQNFKQYLRVKVDGKNEELLKSSWKNMFTAVINAKNFDNRVDENAKKSKKEKLQHNVEIEDKLQLVFHILLLNMGLQLFREVEMAAPAIDDLLKCMQRTKQQQKQKKKHSKDDLSEDSEPEWIEVVIDLFLHLLSQNAGALRSSVNNLFPHLCGNMNVTAIHQILAVLDMKDGQNPLSRKGEGENSDEDSDEEEDEANEQDGEHDSSENDAETTDSEEKVDGDDDDADDDDDEIDDDEDEDITATDKLRNAISQALMANSAAINNTAGNDDDDMASIDLNEMTEEEGRRLDEALATAFKALKTGSGHGMDRKKSKSKRIETTAVMHFRIRVLDLLEIYLQQPTIDLLNHIEIMLALYNMLQYCWSDELKPLQNKVEKVLQKLTTIKPNSVATKLVVHTEELKPEDLVNYIRQIAEQKTPTLAFDLTNKIRNRCIVYLINNATKLPNGDAEVLNICQDYQSEFLQSRNPTVNITLLSEIYKLRWTSIWSLALMLASKGLQMDTRAFRRIQVCEILIELYKNNELQKLNTTATQASLKKIEKVLINYIEALTATWSKPQSRQSHKEFQSLLGLLLHAQRAHTRLKTSSPIICAAATCEKVQELRRHIRLESTHMYHRYCGSFNLSVIRNTDVVIEALTKESDDIENNKIEEKADTTNQKNQKKQKNKDMNARKQKKQKKIERMLAASKGINGGFGTQQQTARIDDANEIESD